MANILAYMKNTLPEVAREANTKNCRNVMRKEVREYAAFLQRVKKTAEQLSYTETVQAIDEDMKFLLEWFVKFGSKDE